MSQNTDTDTLTANETQIDNEGNTRAYRDHRAANYQSERARSICSLTSTKQVENCSESWVR